MLVIHCRFCNNPAAIFLTQIVDGKLTELALCKKCAKARGIFDPLKLTLAEQIFPSEISGEVEKFINHMLESSLVEDAEDDELAALPDMLTECPACHYSIEQYRSSGLLGCPECYKAFSSELAILLEDLGASPEPAAAVEQDYLDSPALERRRLEVLMHDAIRNENYEEAARLRDRIKELPES